jgi:hypothetical protein
VFGQQRPGWFSGSNIISNEALHDSLVYNITMTEHNNLDSNHSQQIKMVTVYASSSATIENSHAWDDDALQYANVTSANA